MSLSNGAQQRSKKGGMTKHQKALTFVAHSSSVTHLTEVVCCLLLVKKNAHDLFLYILRKGNHDMEEIWNYL